MKRILYLIISTVGLVSLASCHKDRVSEEFINSNELCFRKDGNTLIKYDDVNYQIGFNEAEKQFRINNDTMSEYYILDCKEIPSRLEQDINANLRWAKGNSVYGLKDVSFKVKKMDNSGRFWLWSKKEGIEVSVQVIR